MRVHNIQFCVFEQKYYTEYTVLLSTLTQRTYILYIIGRYITIRK